jgi:hypothetical protein
MYTGSVEPRPFWAQPSTSAFVDVRQLLHPRERARFWMALATLTLVGGLTLVVAIHLGGWQLLGGAAGAIILAWASLWIALQLHRARLLGRYLRVTDRSLPALARIIFDQRRLLAFSRRVDFYVADEVDGLISYTSYFGTKIVIIKGDLVADLEDDDRRVQSTYLIGSVLGSLAAKHLRFTPLLIAISALTKVKIFNLLLSPYFRATRYSGDNIGLFLCGSPRAGVQVMHRMLVGKELSSTVHPSGLLDQATEVRRRLLPRLTALFGNEPNLTDRYLNVLNYLDHQFPSEAIRWRQELDPATSAVVARQLAHSPYRTAQRRVGNVWATITAASVVLVLAVAILVLPNPSSGEPSSQSQVPQPPPSSMPGQSDTTSIEPNSTSPAQRLQRQVGPVDDGECAVHAFGQVADDLTYAGCNDLRRALLTAYVEGRPVLISVAEVRLSDSSMNAEFVSLVIANGTGNVRTLLADGYTFPGAPQMFAQYPALFAAQESDGQTVEILMAMWMDDPESTTADTPELTSLLRAIA